MMMNTPEDLTWVKRAYSWNSGGGIWIDVLVLRGGTCLSITDESIIVWESEKHFEENEVDQDGDPRNYVVIGIDELPFWVHHQDRACKNTLR